MNSKTLIEKLELVPENIFGEAAVQPLLYVDAARYRVAAMRSRSQAAAELEYTKARVAAAIRARLTEAGEKVTEKLIEQRVATHKLCRAASEKMDRAQETEEFAKLLLDAYRMRRDAIRIIGEGQIAEGIRGGHEVDRLEQHRRLAKRARDLDSRRGEVHEAPANDEPDDQ